MNPDGEMTDREAGPRSGCSPSKLKLALTRLAWLGYLVEKAGQQQLRVKVPGINRPVFLTERNDFLVEWALSAPSAAELGGQAQAEEAMSRSHG